MIKFILILYKLLPDCAIGNSGTNVANILFIKSSSN